MCTFVTLIAETQDLDGLNAALASLDARGQKRRAEKIVTPGLRPLLRAQETEYWLVRTPCDCGTFLGHAAGGDDDRSAGTGNPAASYRRKGWSQARIGRAIAHRQTARGRPPRRKPNEDAAYWIALLGTVAARLRLNRLGLMHYACRTPPGAEPVAATRLHAGTLATAGDTLAVMDAGVLYGFDCAG